MSIKEMYDSAGCTVEEVMPKPIPVHLGHKIALKAIEALIRQDPEKGTPQSDLLDGLVNAVHQYEAVCWPKVITEKINGSG